MAGETARIRLNHSSLTRGWMTSFMVRSTHADARGSPHARPPSLVRDRAIVAQRRVDLTPRRGKLPERGRVQLDPDARRLRDPEIPAVRHGRPLQDLALGRLVIDRV